MSVAILTITHGDLGKHIVKTAESMLGSLPLPCQSLSVSQISDPDSIFKQAKDYCERFCNGDGVLVLTDIYGSTPGNIANRLFDAHGVAVIAGINVPMLIRVLNYPDLSLEELVNKAVTGGHDGIILCKKEQ